MRPQSQVDDAMANDPVVAQSATAMPWGLVTDANGAVVTASTKCQFEECHLGTLFADAVLPDPDEVLFDDAPVGEQSSDSTFLDDADRGDHVRARRRRGAIRSKRRSPRCPGPPPCRRTPGIRSCS